MTTWPPAITRSITRALRREPRQNELRPVADPALVLGQLGVDRAVEVARAGVDRCAQLRLDLVRRAGEDEPLAQVVADAELVGELDVGGLLLVAGRPWPQVVGLAELEQRRLELVGHELALDARVGEVEGERRRRPGALALAAPGSSSTNQKHVNQTSRSSSDRPASRAPSSSSSSDERTTSGVIAEADR